MVDHKGTVVWFTGLSGSGKTTLAKAAAKQLIDLGWSAKVIDGDELRKDLSAGLGFSKRDREENARRAACMAKEIAHHVDFVLVALIAPYRALRAEIAMKLASYLEVFVNAPLEACEKRDPKQLYRKARAGQLSHFTGLDDPYEPPLKPALVCRTDQETIEQSVKKVLRLVQREPRLAGNCAELLRAAITEDPGITMAGFAKRMGITPRTVARRLRATRDNFRGIREKRLFGLAATMLRGGCDIKQVAFALRFSSPEAFHRFFRRVGGCSPRKFRCRRPLRVRRSLVV